MQTATSGNEREYGRGCGVCGYFSADAREVPPANDREARQYLLSERIDRALADRPDEVAELVQSREFRKDTGSSAHAATAALAMAKALRPALQAVA